MVRSIALVFIASMFLVACDGPAENQDTVKNNSDIIADVTHYVCDDQTEFSVRFMTDPDQAEVTMKDGTAILLPAETVGDEFSYMTPHHQLRGTLQNATWTIGRKMPVQCHAKN